MNKMSSPYLTGTVDFVSVEIDTLNSFVKQEITCTLNVPGNTTITKVFSVDGTFDGETGTCSCEVVFNNLIDDQETANTTYDGTVKLTFYTSDFSTIGAVFANATVVKKVGGTVDSKFKKITDLDQSNYVTDDVVHIQYGTTATLQNLLAGPVILVYVKFGSIDTFSFTYTIEVNHDFTHTSVASTDNFLFLPILGGTGDAFEYVVADRVVDVDGNPWLLNTIIDSFGSSSYDSGALQWPNVSSTLEVNFTLNNADFTVTAPLSAGTAELATLGVSDGAAVSALVEVINISLTDSGLVASSSGTGYRSRTFNLGSLTCNFRPKTSVSGAAYSCGPFFGSVNCGGVFKLDVDDTYVLRVERVDEILYVRYFEGTETSYASVTPNRLTEETIATAHLSSAATTFTSTAFYGTVDGFVVVPGGELLAFGLSGRAIGKYVNEMSSTLIPIGRLVCATIRNFETPNFKNLSKIPVKQTKSPDFRDFAGATNSADVQTEVDNTVNQLNSLVKIGNSIKREKNSLPIVKRGSDEFSSAMVQLDNLFNASSPSDTDIDAKVASCLQLAERLSRNISCFSKLRDLDADSLGPMDDAVLNPFKLALGGTAKGDAFVRKMDSMSAARANLNDGRAVLKRMSEAVSEIDNNITRLQSLQAIRRGEETSFKIMSPDSIELVLQVIASVGGDGCPGKMTGTFAKGDDGIFVPQSGSLLEFERNSLGIPESTDISAMSHVIPLQIETTLVYKSEGLQLLELDLTFVSPVV